MASSSLAKQIDDKTKNIVYGYIRRYRKLLPNDIIYYDIPSLVQHLCISYYWTPKEYFTYHGIHMSVNTARNVATMNKEGYNPEGVTVYGNIDIDDSLLIYKWSFKIIHDDDSAMSIGIDSSNKPEKFCNNTFVFENSNDFYAIRNNGWKYSFLIANEEESEPYSGWTQGDTVKMELNTMQKTLGYYVNDKYHGIAFDNIDCKNKTYKMAVCMSNWSYNAEGELELIAFEVTL
eukprot:512103_1